MRLTVVTAVLLSVGILNSVTAWWDTEELQLKCAEFKDVSCGDGWSRIDDDRCAKFFKTPKTFDEAEKHCTSLDGELVSMKTEEQLWNAVCISRRDNSEFKSVWIGVGRDGEKFTHADGSDVKVTKWYPGQPDNFGGQENCVEMTHQDWEFWNDDNCADKNAFMCSKEM